MCRGAYLKATTKCAVFLAQSYSLRIAVAQNMTMLTFRGVVTEVTPKFSCPSSCTEPTSEAVEQGFCC